MLIKLKRKTFGLKVTLGEMWIGEVWENCTLEDVDRGLKQEMTPEEIAKWKIVAKTAIPYGRYEVIINESVRFKKPMPLLLNVPGFEGVRIHSGNTDADTEGCILVGNYLEGSELRDSRFAFNRLFEKLAKTLNWELVSDKWQHNNQPNHEKVFIDIIKDPDFTRRVMSIDELKPNPMKKAA